MKKILFITPDYYPNSTGFANASVNLVETIKKYGEKKYDIYVVTEAKLGDYKESESATVYRIKKDKGRTRFSRLLQDYASYLLIRNVILNNNIDIIFFETNTFPFIENLILKQFKNKVFVRIHSTADTEVIVFGKAHTLGAKIKNHYIRKFMLEVDNIIATSEYYLEFIRKHYLGDNVYSIWENKMYGILYNTSFSMVDNQDKIVQENCFLTMGKMSSNGVTQKGIEDLIRAIYYLNSRSHLPIDFKLFIIGDGDNSHRIIDLIIALNLGQYIEVIRKADHDEVFKYINNAKGIILLSRYEGQSMFITESLSCGKPIIVTSDNGMSDMVKDEKNGFIVRKGDIIGAAHAIKKIMDSSEKELLEMGLTSKAMFEEKFSPQAVYKQFDALMSFRGCL